MIRIEISFPDSCDRILVSQITPFYDMQYFNRIGIILIDCDTGQKSNIRRRRKRRKRRLRI